MDELEPEPEEEEEILPPARNYTPYGAAAKLWASRDHKIIISGPSETGKTLGCLHKLDSMCWEFPGTQVALVRKTYQSMPGTVLQSFEKQVLGKDSNVHPYGGTRPYMYSYPNGSKIWVGGMDNSQKILSSERDLIYINQAEELTLDDWETLSTRCTGRAGNTPYPQLIADCNPGPSLHWLKQLGDSGNVQFLESRHKDNPTLFHPDTGEITDQGKRTIATLSELTGFRRSRLYLGLWASAEGMVYEDVWDPERNLKTWQQLRWDGPIPPKQWRRHWSIDFGYTNPFCWQSWAEDYDGRLYLYREIYWSQRLVEDHVTEILTEVVASNDSLPADIVADHDAEDRATFEAHCVLCLNCRKAIRVEAVPLHRGHKQVRFNLRTKPAFKAISAGIQAVAARMKPAGDGRARLVILRSSLVERDPKLSDKRKPASTAEEVEGYVWPKGQDNKPIKEVPVDTDNHGMDGSRYVVAHVDQIDRIKGGIPRTSAPRSRYLVK